jgi:hypothetical protein
MPLASILNYGLLPRSALEKWPNPPQFVDSERFDNRKDAICLSIGFPNYQMFNTRRASGRIGSWVVLEIKADVLWEMDCAFCWHNAASREIIYTPIDELRKFDSLLKMFADEVLINGESRRRHAIPSWYTTNPQAEVLAFGGISPEKISCLHVEDSATLSQCQSLITAMGSLQAKIGRQYFRARQDYSIWRKTVRSEDQAAWPEDPFSCPF